MIDRDGFEPARSTDKSDVKRFAVTFAVFGLCGTVDAQRWFVSQHQPDERIVGLLNLPDVTGNYADDACGSKGLMTVQVYSQPSVGAAATGSVYMREHPEYGCGLLFRRQGSAREEELPTEESDYEVSAAVVHERRGQWFRIAVPQGSAWIERANANDFLSYPEILMERLSYLRSDWDGQLRQGAGLQFPFRPLPAEWKEQGPRQIGVEVLGVTRVGSDDWIHVRFETDRCGDDRVSKLKPVEGWLPAHRADGRPSAWFYSRGC